MSFDDGQKRLCTGGGDDRLPRGQIAAGLLLLALIGLGLVYFDRPRPGVPAAMGAASLRLAP